VKVAAIGNALGPILQTVLHRTSSKLLLQPGLADWQHEEELGERVAEQIDEAKEKWAGDDNRGWGNSTPKSPQSNHEKQAFRPFQGVGQKIKDLRR
jgi:hypothetical protein